MRLNVFRSLWGVIKEADGPKEIPKAIEEIAKLGYKGVEAPMFVALGFGKDKFKTLLKDHGLSYIPMIFTDGPIIPGELGYPGHPKAGKSVVTHFEVWKAQAEEAQDFDPVFVNSHSGKDYWTQGMAIDFFGRCLDFQKSQGCTVYHETHRKRYLHSPWVTRDILPHVQGLEFVADLSHWLCVAETDTNDEELNDVVESLAPHVRHIHARVGYDHGPQVPDPSAPEWLPYTEGHERWWKLIWERQKVNGMEVTTLTPEHGPPNYQVTEPRTKKPLADIWEVNHWIAERQKEAFNKGGF